MQQDSNDKGEEVERGHDLEGNDWTERLGVVDGLGHVVGDGPVLQGIDQEGLLIDSIPVEELAALLVVGEERVNLLAQAVEHGSAERPPK